MFSCRSNPMQTVWEIIKFVNAYMCIQFDKNVKPTEA